MRPSLLVTPVSTPPAIDLLHTAVIRLGSRLFGCASIDDARIQTSWEGSRWVVDVHSADAEFFRAGFGPTPTHAFRDLLEMLVGEVRHRYPRDVQLIDLGLGALGVSR
jgi:hypothetical protein